MTRTFQNQPALAMYLAIFSMFLLNSTSIMANESKLKYWISKNYKENPEVNAGNAKSFSPLIVKPDLPLSSSPSSADVFICFDDRPLQDSFFGAREKAPGDSKERVSFCEKNNSTEGFGYLYHPLRKK